MAEPLGHERQINFFKNDGHNHDGENSSPVALLRGSVQLFHLNEALQDWIQGGSTGAPSGGDNSVMPVPDLIIETPPIGPGASYTASVDWVGISFVRFMRVLMSQDSECTITFYHKSTFLDEDREFRAFHCGNRFLWEGTWAHFDEEETKRIHYKIENTGNQSCTFQLHLKSGTMAANAYSRFVEQIRVGEEALTGQLTLRSGNGVEVVAEGNIITLNATAPETIFINRWTLTPTKPASYTASAAIGNVANLSNGQTGSIASFGSGLQWIQADMGGVVNLGAVKVIQYMADGRVFNGVRIEISADGTNWLEVKASGQHWGNEEGITAHIASGYLARYIRVWCNGSNADGNNYISKIIPLALSNKG